jgi:sporulation protein YlmC with PRC-barrel domain
LVTALFRRVGRGVTAFDGQRDGAAPIGFQMTSAPEEDQHNPTKRRRTAAAALHERIAARRAIAHEVISLAHLLGRRVVNDAGTRVGNVSDIVVRWDAGVSHPPVIAVLARVGSGFAVVDVQDVMLSQNGVRMRSGRKVVSAPVREEGDVALARDVLDRQLVDIAGVQVVRAADVYLLDGPRGWELAGIDVGVRSFGCRLLPKRRICPPPNRVIDWADLQTFVPRFTDTALPGKGPAAAAGIIGGGVQLGRPAAELKKLRATDVAAILADLGRGKQAQIAKMAPPLAAVEGLRQLNPAQRDALLAELSAPDRARLQAMLEGGATT